MTSPASALLRPTGGRIVLLVIDGLGGLPHPEHGGRSELEQARLPALDALARASSVGRLQILARGLTPGSGPGHLSLFGYDPHAIDFGRGVLEALGSDHPLVPGEVAARGNFCTLDAAGVITDRRAGRPTDAECRALCTRIQQEVRVSGAEFILLPGKQHRFTLVMRAPGLGAHVRDNDPQVEGQRPLEFTAGDAASRHTAELVTEFWRQSRALLAAEPRASGLLLRGFSTMPPVPGFLERYGLRAACIAIYPMYRGVARLVGMEILPPGKDLAAQIEVARAHWDRFDFFFLHTKDPDTAGHAGDFAGKVAALEAIDAHIAPLRALGAEVLIVTGDHSTPTVHREHSWHPVPVLVHSARCVPNPHVTFDERGVQGGDLQTLPALDLMTLALAHAGRLDKFGA